jgi:hypothetical protein
MPEEAAGQDGREGEEAVGRVEVGGGVEAGGGKGTGGWMEPIGIGFGRSSGDSWRG